MAALRAFVCLHGFLDDTTVWDGIAPALAALGRVVLVQQRGHGDSTAPEGACSVDDLASDVLALLDALAIERPVLVGHALGGLIAAKVALRIPAPVAGLVLISAFSEIDERAAARWRDVVRAGEVNKLQGLARSVYGPTSRREVDGDGGALTEIARALQALAARARHRAARCAAMSDGGAGGAERRRRERRRTRDRRGDPGRPPRAGRGAAAPRCTSMRPMRSCRRSAR